jgi:phosphoribosylamine--glycine ligase
MKDLLLDAGVPTATYATFDDPVPAAAYLRNLPGGPYVIKTDGLAAGKGVLVTTSVDQAIDDVRSKLSGEAFGEAGRRVVIEEGLTGEELSVMAICDGRRALPLAVAQDFKRLGDGDSGPNTGGMGAYSPVGVDVDVVNTVMDKAVEPTLAALRRRGIDYRGVLYAGVMLTADGPRILEFNVRFGDPETQAVMPLWQGDVADVLAAAAAGDLADRPPPAFGDQAAVSVVLAAEGYPRSPTCGDVIEGVEEAATIKGVRLYAAAVGSGRPGQLVTAGGRVLAVTGLGAGLVEARTLAYQAVEAIDWRGINYRRDIGQRAAAAAPASEGSLR